MVERNTNEDIYVGNGTFKIAPRDDERVCLCFVYDIVMQRPPFAVDERMKQQTFATGFI